MGPAAQISNPIRRWRADCSSWGMVFGRLRWRSMNRRRSAQNKKALRDRTWSLRAFMIWLFGSRRRCGSRRSRRARSTRGARSAGRPWSTCGSGSAGRRRYDHRRILRRGSGRYDGRGRGRRLILVAPGDAKHHRANHHRRPDHPYRDSSFHLHALLKRLRTIRLSGSAPQAIVMMGYTRKTSAVNIPMPKQPRKSCDLRGC